MGDALEGEMKAVVSSDLSMEARDELADLGSGVEVTATMLDRLGSGHGPSFPTSAADTASVALPRDPVRLGQACALQAILDRRRSAIELHRESGGAFELDMMQPAGRYGLHTPSRHGDRSTWLILEHETQRSGMHEKPCPHAVGHSMRPQETSGGGVVVEHVGCSSQFEPIRYVVGVSHCSDPTITRTLLEVPRRDRACGSAEFETTHAWAAHEGARVENAEDLLNQFVALSASELPLIAEDAVFGVNTRNAVLEFETATARVADGVLTLGESIALARLVAELEQDAPVILPGEQTASVQTWQSELNDWNRLTTNDLPIDPDGIYGPNSVAATRVFEAEADLQVDGIVEPEDRAAMRGSLEDLRAEAGDLPPLSVGDSGSLVQTTQSLLNEYFGYAYLDAGPISEDGLYGRNTRDAARVFEANEGLVEDGVLTRSDIDRLRSAVAELENAAANSTIQLDDRGDLVETWQRPLAEWIRAEAAEGTVSDASTLGDIVSASDFTQADADLLRLYYVFFDRDPDVGGVRYWIDRSRDDLGHTEIAEFFATSPEFDDTYGDLDDREFVAVLYRNALEREADGEGFEFWVGELEQSLRSRAEVVRQFGFSPEFIGNNPFGGQ